MRAEVPSSSPLAEDLADAPLPQVLLTQVLYYRISYTAKTILFITQHRHIQDFAERDANLNHKLTFLYVEVCTVSSTRRLK